MAKSMITIQLEYNKLIKQAKNLDEAAAKLKKAANNNMGDAIGTLQSSWKSDTAPAFISKGNTLKQQLLKQADDVAKAAEGLRQIAKSQYNAEKKALELAQQRTYKG